ncbi:hypothetical protein [Nocardia sp. CC227C]|uniref:hypothetical protein n=1 Tax=Nocardia sp. CC227C TaxID=3044562 RepID=UPI00278BB79B|nr:hypothetical protein [Nocardia sp. CC227C]
MIESFARTDAAVVRGIGTGLSLLPVGIRLALFAAALLVGMAGCTAAWVDYQDYQPSLNICRADEVHRTDCIHLDRTAPNAAEVAR